MAFKTNSPEKISEFYIKMQTLDSNKLVVRESFDQIAEKKQRMMDSHAKFVWLAVFCIGLFTLAHCVPLDVVYTGEGCDCPRKLDFLVNVPKVPTSRKYTPQEYGYRLDVPVPVQAKAKVSYTFDFTVEEPLPPRPPPPPSKWNLYAKVDRVAIKKGDCAETYAAPSAPSTCSCGQCGASQPHYRYVYKEAPACNCQCGNCKCNLARRASQLPFASNAIVVARVAQPPLPQRLAKSIPLPMSISVPMTLPFALPIDGSGGDTVTAFDGGNVIDVGEPVGGVNIRRKRDLQRAFFRPRKFVKERPGRFVKYYHKNLPGERPPPLFGFDAFTNQMPKKVKRKAKKARFTHQRSRLVKRDIKGEYELLEKEREQMDLTLPEIIQFMPETLQPNFKRGQCYFGCPSCLAAKHPETTIQEPSDNKEAPPTPNDIRFNNDSDSDNNTSSNLEYENSSTTPTNEKDAISHKKNFLNDTDDPVPSIVDGGTSFQTKRNAASYKLPPAAASAYPTSAMYEYMPSLVAKSAYPAYFKSSQFPTNPLYETQQQSLPQPELKPQNVYSAKATAAPTSSCACSGHSSSVDSSREKYPTSNGPYFTFYPSKQAVPDPADRYATPLQYAGDLEPRKSDSVEEELSLVGAPKYPVQHISNEQLDKIITEIIFRHPEFIDASSHYGGALIDPEPWQEQETIEFLKKLIDGRLSLWFSEEDDYNTQYSSVYNNPYNYNMQQMFRY